LVFGLLRQYPDGLLVGAGTVRVEGYNAVRLDEQRRAWRSARGLDPYPRLIVISRRLDLDPSYKAFTEAPRRPAILTSRAAPPDRRRRYGISRSPTCCARMTPCCFDMPGEPEQGAGRDDPGVFRSPTSISTTP